MGRPPGVKNKPAQEVSVPASVQGSYQVVEVEQKEQAISQAGGKYQYPIEIAAKQASLRPRNERDVLNGALDELSLSPKLAAESYYSIPRRKKLPSGEFEVVKIEGPSIGAAMSLARRWGNAINGSHIREELDDRIVCEGVFIDAQTNTWTFRTIAAEKYFTDKATKIKRPLQQDMLLNAIQAAQSKAVRNAILSTLPKWLTRAYFDEAKRIAGGGDLRSGQKAEMSPEERMDWLLKHFPSVGVSPEMAKKYTADNLSNMDISEQVGELRGIFNALKEKQATVDEIFNYTTVDKSRKDEPGPVSGAALFPGDTGSL